MGTAIAWTAVSADPAVHSSIAHASTAADECLRRAGVEPGQVGLLINAGVYRDSNMAEPAMAALIQKNVGMNLDYVRDPRACFSFDLMNGACGVLNAVQVAGAFLDTGSAGYALVVSGDAHPSGRVDPDFPYASVGAAMLLRRTTDGATGFGRVRTAAAHDDAGHAVTGFMDVGNAGTRGRETITVRRDADHAPRLVEFAAAQARAHADAAGVDLTGVLLVASRPTPTFAAEVADRLGIAASAVVTVGSVDGDPHSSALTVGYHEAVATGLADRYPLVLFLAVGAGPTAACSFYRRADG
jgi:3-oxoacyl-[acyl-carrier-protein] synthase III